ncbi:MAG: hypothetical protein M5R36_06320 [Deltaproteobacteria bacterium]|nr:hypothetical protein [Deltaproteobacteria bacterium]
MFSLLGLGYLTLEIVLIQRMQIFVGMPVLAFATVLGAMLLSSGIGGYVSRAWPRGRIVAFMGALPVVALAAYFLSGALIDVLIGLPQALRVAVTVALAAPLGFLLGLPFPHALAAAREVLGDRFGAALFGLNGAFSALGTPLALAAAMAYGFRTTYLAGCAIYILCIPLVALLLFGRSPDAPSDGPSLP